MALWDTIKSGAGDLASTGISTGVELLKDEISSGVNKTPPTRPDTKSQPVASTQQFENPKKAINFKSPMVIGGAAAVAVLAFVLIRRK